MIYLYACYGKYAHGRAVTCLSFSNFFVEYLNTRIYKLGL